MSENIKINADTFEFDCKFNNGNFCLEIGPDKSAIITSFDESGESASIPFSKDEFKILSDFINEQLKTK